jgi:oligopeptidase B
MTTDTTKHAAATNPPIAKKSPLTRTFHGLSLVDDYAWLKDENWQKVLRDPSLLDPEIRAYLEAENRYAEALLAPTEALQKALVAEMRGRIKEDDASVPQPDGPFAYLSRYREGGQHPLIGRLARDGDWRQGDAAAIVLDGDQLAKDSTYFKFGGVRHSPDHRLEAWCADRRGSEFYTIRVRDWQSGEDLPDILEQTSGGSVVWGQESTFFFYVQVDENHRPLKVYRHRLGTPQGADMLVYEEKDTGWFTRVHESASGRFCVISSGDHETSECRLIDLAVPDAEPRLVAERQAGVRYGVYDRGDELFILTDEGNAVDFRIAVAPIATPDRSHWRELIAHRPGVYIVSVALYADWLVRLERSNALPAIVVRRLSDGEEHAIAFDEAAYSLDIVGGYEFDTTTLRFAYSSMTTPSEVWDYDMASRQRTLRKRQEIPSGHDPAQYVTTRIMAPSPNGADGGALVPVSILHRRDFERDGSAPLLLYGYGSYGMAMPASFAANRLSLVDRGFAYAIAHVRGGSDKGYGWYLDGKREKKTNTFADFEAAARALIAAGYTSVAKIVGHGGSAGGMLMGAVANRAPDLFAGIIAEVPFVDVLNTMLDDTLPLTPPEWPEWGNPITDAAAYRTILAYSPYDNVAAQRYPAILAMAGLTDPRVTYWEPAKWVARLRATMTGGGPIVLRTNMGAGHGGAAGRFDRLDEVALAYAFALQVTDSR